MSCFVCQDPWLYKTKHTWWLCESCYQESHEIVLKYHQFQNQAFQALQNNNLTLAVDCLKETMQLRNSMQKYFENGVNRGHHRFANEFIPQLIDLLENESNPENRILIWEREFHFIQRDLINT